MPDYEKLDPHERLRLVVDALARQDEAEAKRLYESCPDNSLEPLDSALDKIVAFLVLNLLMAERRQAKDEGAGQAVANLLAAADTFCSEIGIPLTHLSAVSLQLSELIGSLSPLTAGVPADQVRVAELADILRGCWESRE
ncbi:MAG: hypothetical protein M0Z41_11280 [Peptococcaceae bacterium]|jgi:hypothetical protein|nr:hypothetical protein [Peptococcaceae bacterium]